MYLVLVSKNKKKTNKSSPQTVLALWDLYFLCQFCIYDSIKKVKFMLPDANKQTIITIATLEETSTHEV